MNCIKINCQNCHESFDLNLDDMQHFCPYCGSKLLFDSNQIKHIYSRKEKSSYIEEKFRCEQEKTKRTQLELAYQERKETQDREIYLKILTGCAAIMLFFIGLLFSMERKELREHRINNELQLTVSSEELVNKNYQDVAQIFRSAGFENIELIQKDDLWLGILKKDGTVESVSINGDSLFESGEWVSSDAIIKITYHSFPD